MCVRQRSPQGTQDKSGDDELEVVVWGIGKMKENCSNDNSPLSKEKNPFCIDDSRERPCKADGNADYGNRNPAKKT